MKIMYPQDDDTVAVMAVNPRLLETQTMVEIGTKHVPAGKNFKIVEDSDLPEDDTFWAAWRVDFSKNNDGTGEAA